MILWGMAHEENRQSAELERLRAMLFPGLSPEEGRRRIDAALEGATDSERAQRIEALANDPALLDELFGRLARQRENGLS
jgi:hypothetical protein